MKNPSVAFRRSAALLAATGLLLRLSLGFVPAVAGGGCKVPFQEDRQAHRRGGPQVPRRRAEAPARPDDRGRPGVVGAGDLHHLRYRDPRRRPQRGAHRRGRATSPSRPPASTASESSGTDLRRQHGAAQARPGAAGAGRSQAQRRALPPRRLARRPVRLRPVLPARRRPVQEPPRRRGHHAQQPRPQGAARHLGRLAQDLAADAQGLRAAGRDRQQGRGQLGINADTGAMWRSKYDMPPDAFTAALDRLWTEVEPLYKSLHCYVRAELN